MAITQLLAMITSAELIRCQTQVHELERLVTYRFSRDRYLDLDWAANDLELCFRHFDQPSHIQDALRYALDGSKQIDPEFAACLPNGGIWSDITYLSADQVGQLSQTLQIVVPSTVFASLPERIHKQLGSIEQSQRYFKEKFRELNNFYRTAAQHEMAVVIWWD